MASKDDLKRERDERFTRYLITVLAIIAAIALAVFLCTKFPDLRALERALEPEAVFRR